MRYLPRQKQRTHRKIVSAAARRFRQRGFHRSGVDLVMKTAGLTPGGFYAHFDSKEALLAETLDLAEREMRDRLLAELEALAGVEWLQEVVRRYLSRTHRDEPAGGCVLPALAAEAPRLGRRGRAALESYITRLADELEPRTPGRTGLEPRDRVLATLALCAGGLMLARAVRDPVLSDRILRACRHLAVPEAQEAPPAGETRAEEEP